MEKQTKKMGNSTILFYNCIIMQLSYIINLNNISPVVNLAHLADNKNGIDIDNRIMNDFELVYILDGEGTVKILEKKIKFKKGDLIFMPPFVMHRYIPHNVSVPHYALHFNFGERLEGKYKKNKNLCKGYKKLRIVTSHQNDIPIFIPDFPKNYTIEFQELINQFKNVSAESYSVKALLIKELLIRILRNIINYLNKNRESERKFLEKSLNYIDNNFTKKITIPFLSEIESLTPNYYSSLFKKNFGLSPMAYITEKRINMARIIMRNKSYKIKEIAYLTGFEDEYYFSKVFKKTTGMSPGQFKVILE